ncbi:hypothetical protein [Bradyrhizobium elkanii]|uniref:hypothetical protein n=1 Tax=Bradyrhizobium elkanii TaxID=29448 RepID=UPI00084229B8|nr:hypothetical protein [Bradyrhizobium elkanii]ODM74993.1 hypothetical protein A6452_38715 [Bradyrhizobium elkanii]ODM82822.1 hypothetical protein A6X20_17050 [Bradyrhizobium elkanii]
MRLNHFFLPECAFKVPGRVYARLIEWNRSEYALFDAVDADWFDGENASSLGPLTSGRWLSLSTGAPVYAIEINSRLGEDLAALEWLDFWSGRLPTWLELQIFEDEHGPANLYGNINGPAVRVRFSQAGITPHVLSSLKRVTDLSPYAKSGDELREALPADSVERVFVLDVGQGAANALVTKSKKVLAYIDLGAGVLADTGTWPAAMTGICLKDDPVVVLTHWHYDHFHAANKFTTALNRTWIAPFQRIGPGPQSAMASSIAQNGNLLIWNGKGILKKGAIELERCTGSTGNFNRSGIAVWVNGPNHQDDPILLPGDAGYSDIPSLKRSVRSITSLVVSHHGGRAPGKAPAKPNLSTARAAMSFGNKNSYKHPLAPSIAKLQKAGWLIGFPKPVQDDRRTEDRGLKGLGTIDLRWSGSAIGSYPCNCGCSIEPTQ